MPVKIPTPKASTDASWHSRSRHRAPYDFAALTRSSPELAGFVHASPTGRDTIDFADPAAVMALNRALLKHEYGIAEWSVPPGYLCPPIPGRAEYVHHLADLIGEDTAPSGRRGGGVVVLDIGVGANCVFPIIGACEYGWSLVGTEIDPVALDSARRIVAANPILAGRIDCRLQRSATDIFRGAVLATERFAASMCNPPFHASPAAAATETRRKLRNLGGGRTAPLVRNFGGQPGELWCAGGEATFLRRMVEQSAARPELCRWFTTLVSKRDSLPALHRALNAVNAAEVRTIELAQGQKKSRILAWRFRKQISRTSSCESRE